MVDITKCSGENCPLKEHCKRYSTKGSEYQSYIYPPFEVKDKIFSCKMFWGATETNILDYLKGMMKGT